MTAAAARRAALAVAVLLALAGPPSSTSAQGAGSDWPAYLHDSSGSGFTSETLITPANAASLRERAGWPVHLSNGAACPSANDYCSDTLSGQPVIVTIAGSRLVYAGSWDGSEYALCADSCTIGATTYSSGQVVWSTYVGRTSGCGGPLNSQIIGVSATTPVSTITVGGTPTSAVFVGAGGDIDHSGAVLSGASSTLYALDALTGAVIWHTPLGSAPSHFLYSSPVLANGSLYIGMASLSDCPLVQGKVLQLDPNTGQVLNTFPVVPDGCLGGGVWGSVTVDGAGNLWAGTGNGGACSKPEPYATAVIELSPTLAPLGSWQLPHQAQLNDLDFGSTPTLFTGTVSSTGAPRSLLGISSKDGYYYVFDRAHLAAGPVKAIHIAVASTEPFVGGSISPSSWDGTRLYVAGGKTVIRKVTYKGSLRAFDPNNLGRPVWQVGFDAGAVIGAVTSDPGLAVASEGAFMMVVDSASGKSPFRDVGSQFMGGASISNGVIYNGATDGTLHAVSVGGV